MKITQQPTQNYGPRRDGKRPDLLILHYTDTIDTARSMEIMLDPAREASAHYLIDEDGSIIQLVAEEHRAWHAGKSYWGGETDINSASIGIEIQNPGHSNGLRPFPALQMSALRNLCADIITRHGILPYNVLAHSDIAPVRKIDPGPFFDWQGLAAQGIGVWPDADISAPIEADIGLLLKNYGYDPAVDLPGLIAAFQLHFEPEVYQGDGTPGMATPRTMARLQNLLTRKTQL